MRLWVTGDDDGALVARLGRYLPLDITAGRPEGTDRHAVIWIGPGVDETVLENPGIELVVLIEPGLEERDRMMRVLATKRRPRLEVIEHVAAEIHAERTWAIVLSLLSGIHLATDALHSESIDRADLVVGPPVGGSWLNLNPPMSPYGLTLGFVGFRPMAWRVAVWADQMGMRVVYAPQGADRECAVEIEGAALKSGASEVAFDEVLATSDVLVLDVGYSDDSIQLFGAAELSLVPPGAHLVNTSHGRAIDEGALIQALRGGRLAGVALDRFNYEPLPNDSPLRQFDAVMCTPGIAAPENDAILVRMAQRVVVLVSDLDADIQIRRVRRMRPRLASGRRR